MQSIRKFKVRHVVDGVTAILAVLLVFGGHAWLALLPLVLLATWSLPTRFSSIRYWPLGLVLIIVSGYVGYIVQWYTGQHQVTHASSRVVMTAQALFFLGCSLWRHVRAEEQDHDDEKSKALTVGLILLPFTFVVAATIRTRLHPFEMMSTFLSAGDHSRHASFIYALAGNSSETGFTDPLSPFAYPKGIHYLLTNVIVAGREDPRVSLLRPTNLYAAWFEWIQFAAYIQAFVLVVFKSVTHLQLRWACAIGALVVAASTPDFVFQLVFAGFTTSLAATWIVLLAVAIPWRQLDSREQLIGILVFGLSLGVTYQYYVVPFAVVALLLILNTAMPGRVIGGASGLLMSLGLTIGVFVLLLLVGGESNPAVSSLGLDGATTSPNFYTVVFWTLVALIGLPHQENLRVSIRDNLGGMILGGLIGMVMGCILIVTLTTDFSVTQQPYYTQKMLWTLLYVALPVAILGLVETIVRFVPREDLTKDLAKTFLVVLPFLPFLLFSRTPQAAFKHSTLDWFARSIIKDFSLTEIDSSAALRANDSGGTHLANLALWGSSNYRLQDEVIFKDSGYLACRVIFETDVRLIFTDQGGRTNLLNYGCPADRRYVEEGKEVKEIRSEIPILEIGRSAVVGSTPDLSKFLHQGFHGDERYVRWATGVGSTVAFQLRPSEMASTVTIEYLGPDSSESAETVNLSIGTSLRETRVLLRNEVGSLTLPIPNSDDDLIIWLRIDCEWSDEEFATLASGGALPKCLGLRSIRLD